MIRHALRGTVGLCLLALPVHAQACPPAGLDVRVTPSFAPPGTPISVSVTNTTTTCTYKLPSTCLFGTVHPQVCSNPPVLGYACGAAITPIRPGQTRTAVWDQRDMSFTQVPDGTYAFDIRVWDQDFTVLMSFCPTVDICSTPAVSYGTASPGTGGLAPAIGTAGGFATIGNRDFSLTVQSGLGAAPAVLLLGNGSASIALPWGTVLVDPSRVIPIPLLLDGTPGAAGQGSATVRAPIPPATHLVGADLFAQTLIVDAGSSGGVSTTDGLQFTVCPR